MLLKIAIIGGGSYLWAFGFIRQFVDSELLKDVHLTLADIDTAALDLIASAGERYNREAGSPVTLEKTTDLDAALDGAAFVIASISTGGLEAMRVDIEVPEKYRMRPW